VKPSEDVPGEGLAIIGHENPLNPLTTTSIGG